MPRAVFAMPAGLGCKDGQTDSPLLFCQEFYAASRVYSTFMLCEYF